MPKQTKRSPLRSYERSLTDRVRDRVAEASRALDRSKPGEGRSSKAKRSRLAASGAKPISDATRENRSLIRVYRELRGTYRRHRAQSGQAALPELREAVHAFKKGPSLPALVSVAVFLDERGLLAW
jgi:hypothetical protein